MKLLKTSKILKLNFSKNYWKLGCEKIIHSFSKLFPIIVLFFSPQVFSDHNRAISTMAPLNLPPACKPYPSDLKSLEECCDVPLLFSDEQYGACEHMCSHEKDTSPDCPVKWLLKFNNIMKNSVINKTAIEAYFDQHGTNDPNWQPITKSALESCHIVVDTKVSLKKALEDFEDCMNIKFEEHCIHFKDSEGCGKVEEFIFKCQNFKHNCSVWPTWFVKLPETCCDGRPELFDSNLYKKAHNHCKKQDLFSKGEQMRCQTTFMLNESKIRTDEKWNFDVASKRLTENSKNNSKWKTPIEKTMETCQKQVQGLIKITFVHLFHNFVFKNMKKREKRQAMSTFGSMNASKPRLEICVLSMQ